MRILALDAATQALSVAVYDSAHAQAAREHFEIAARAHAARLLPVAAQLLDEIGWRLADLDGLAFGRGPGAFTGLRIAAGFVQGLAYGSDLPVAPVSTLTALAARALERHAGDAVRVVQDARMGEIYTADFHRNDFVRARRASARLRAQTAERVIRPERLAPTDHHHDWLFAGNGWPVVVQVGGPGCDHVCEQWPHAGDIAGLGAALLERGEGVPAHQALPVYVRDDVARKPG